MKSDEIGWQWTKTDNDETLERIYIGRRFRNDTERLEKLFELYTKMTAAPKAKSPSPQPSSQRGEGAKTQEGGQSMSDSPISLSPPPAGYADWLADLKGRIQPPSNVPRWRSTANWPAMRHPSQAIQRNLTGIEVR